MQSLLIWLVSASPSTSPDNGTNKHENVGIDKPSTEISMYICNTIRPLFV